MNVLMQWTLMALQGVGLREECRSSFTAACGWLAHGNSLHSYCLSVKEQIV